MHPSIDDEIKVNAESALASGRSAATSPAVAIEAVDTVLQSYASRGVFQELHRQSLRLDRAAFHFGWLHNQPYTLVCDAIQKKLVLSDLFPGITRDSLMFKELKAFLKNRSHSDIAEHRRIDPTKARVVALLRGGAVSIELASIDADFSYACTRLINLAHESFLFLSEYWPDYMYHYFQSDME
jgi:hypothetical protein